MGSGLKKNKPNQKHRANSLPSKVDNEYDLERNIKKINSYSRNRNNNRDKSHRHITDSVENEGLNSHENGFIEVPHISPVPLRTGDHAVWDSYTRLDDKITDFNYKNDQAHTDLRRELESKIKEINESFLKSIKDCNDAISERLQIQWYVWTIIGLVAIVGIWYMFSYVDVHPLPKKVEELDKRLYSIEKKIDVFTKDTVISIVNK